MIEFVNSYYIYTLSNDLIMNMNRKIRATMVEIITKDSKQGHYGGNYNKGFKQGHYRGDYNKRFKQGHYGGTPGLQGLWAHGLQGYITTGL